MNPGRQPDYRKLTEHLEAQIASGCYRPGDKLPALRELTTEFGLTGYAVHQGLKQLQEKGLVALRRGSGAYVADLRRRQPSAVGWNVTVFVGTPQISSGYLSCALLGIQEAAIGASCSVTIRKRDYYEFYEPEPPLASTIGNADGLIFLGEYDYRDFEVPRTLPVVGIEMGDTKGGVISPVTLDPVTAAELAVVFFRHRRIGRVRVHFLGSGPVFRLRAEMFRLRWLRYGEVEMVPYCVGERGNIDIPDDPGIGLLFCSGSRCEDFLKYYEHANSGRPMTDRFAIVSIDGKSRVMPNYSPVSSIGIDWRSAGRAAFSELVRRLEHPSAEARRIYLVPRLDELPLRESVVRPALETRELSPVAT